MRVFSVAMLSLLFVSGAAHTAERLQGEALLEVIQSRKSVRHFTGAPVTKSDLVKVIRAGMAAPSARNRQPWSFVAVTDRKKLDALAAVHPSGRLLNKAGAAIIVCTDPGKAAGGSRDYAVIDASLAGENMLLAIEALGLGGVWTAVYPDADLMDAVRSQLGIPRQVIPLNLIPVGAPTGEDRPKDKYRAENIHWEKW